MKYSLEFLEKSIAFEERWDGKLGNETRAHRELLAYTAARILQAGNKPGDVVDYLRELIAEFWSEDSARGDA